MFPGHLAALDGEVVSRKGALRVKIDFDGHLVDVVVTHLIGEGGHEKIKTAITYVVICVSSPSEHQPKPQPTPPRNSPGDSSGIYISVEDSAYKQYQNMNS